MNSMQTDIEKGHIQSIQHEAMDSQAEHMPVDKDSTGEASDI